ncbi:uncharacterized protein [Halyomorpha halys]|uniref:uncharacterized protein n=1 Tax=Halyomorpha halys TaxID=286706 RepID=UPI0034D2B76C
MESKAARIQQWLRDLKLPSLRSWSKTDVSSLSSEDRSEELEIDPERAENTESSSNTDKDSTKKWKSSQNLPLVRFDEQSPNEWECSHRSKEDLYNDFASEESLPSCLTTSNCCSAESTQSLHEIYHLQHYFTRTMKLEQSHPNSPELRKKLSTSDSDLKCYSVNNTLQDIRGATQSTSGIEIINTVQSLSKTNVTFRRILTNSSITMNIQEEHLNTKIKKPSRCQFPFDRPKVAENLHNPSRRRLPIPPQSGRDNTVYPHQLVTHRKYKAIQPNLIQQSTQSNSLSYDHLETHGVNTFTHNSEAEISSKNNHLRRSRDTVKVPLRVCQTMSNTRMRKRVDGLFEFVGTSGPKFAADPSGVGFGDKSKGACAAFIGLFSI